MRPTTLLITLLMTMGWYCNSAQAERNNLNENAEACFDGHNPDDIRIWTRAAPGAAGELWLATLLDMVSRFELDAKSAFST